MIAQPNDGCDLSNPMNWRTRTSIHVSMGGHHIQVDAAPEFRMQCIQNQVTRIDTFILTHPHADHILGMDDLRRFVILMAALRCRSTAAKADCNAYAKFSHMLF